LGYGGGRDQIVKKIRRVLQFGVVSGFGEHSEG